MKNNEENLELRVIELVVEVVHLPEDDRPEDLVELVREDLVDVLHWAHAVGVKVSRRGWMFTDDAREGDVEWDTVPADPRQRLTDTELCWKVLAAAMDVAPTGVEQDGFSQLAQDVADPRERLIALLEGMLDGVRHGNWPVRS